MKKVIIILSCLVLVFAFSFQVMAKGGNKDCTTIQDGVLTYSAGHYLEEEPLQTGYDPYGYNYQAHMFNGLYCNAYLGKDGLPPYEGDDEAYLAENPSAEFKWYWPYRNTQLMMKWSDEWLSNKDCNEDGKLDRGYSCDPVIANSSACEGAWLTNHQAGGKGKDHWTYFVKIITPPEDAVKMGDVWYTADETEIGPAIWGAFAVIQRVSSGVGATYVSPAGPGLGKY